MENRAKEGFQGIAFGVMDGVILALGVITGLSVLENRSILFLSLLATGLADAFGNAAGMHVEEETEKDHGRKEVWISTISAFFSTFFVFLLLLIPILILPLTLAVAASWILGIALLTMLGIKVAVIRQWNSSSIVIEYVLWGIAVSVASYLMISGVKSLSLI